MDSFVSGKDKMWFLRVCHHVPHELYRVLCNLLVCLFRVRSRYFTEMKYLEILYWFKSYLTFQFYFRKEKIVNMFLLLRNNLNILCYSHVEDSYTHYINQQLYSVKYNKIKTQNTVRDKCQTPTTYTYKIGFVLSLKLQNLIQSIKWQEELMDKIQLICFSLRICESRYSIIMPEKRFGYKITRTIHITIFCTSIQHPWTDSSVNM